MFSRITAAIVITSSLAAAGAAPAGAQEPSLSAHAIFSGGQRSSFHVGQVLQLDVRGRAGRMCVKRAGRRHRSLAPRAAAR